MRSTFVLFVGGALALAAHASPAPPPGAAAVTSPASPRVDPIVSIRSILNASPEAVAKKLGGPDKPLTSTKDCDFLPAPCITATYGHGRVEALFRAHQLKWLSVNLESNVVPTLVDFGFADLPPTSTNAGVRSWRSDSVRGTATGPTLKIPGLRQIDIFASRPDQPGYALIAVDADYSKPL